MMSSSVKLTVIAVPRLSMIKECIFCLAAALRWSGVQKLFETVNEIILLESTRQFEQWTFESSRRRNYASATSQIDQ